MMIMSPRDEDHQVLHAKDEGSDSPSNLPSIGKYTKGTAPAASSSGATSSSTRQWSGFKNPRIVRVSRAFGGKDRHSKVCTIRGLRDRRIRLSVPTAIQLYDLQDRLNLSQPSKVIDWLLDATKLDVDRLPPLQIPPGSFDPFAQVVLAAATTTRSSSSSVGREMIKWNRTSSSRSTIHEGHRDHGEEDDDQYGAEVGVGSGGHHLQVSAAQCFFPINMSTSSTVGNTFPAGPGFLASNISMPYNYYHWNPAASNIAQLGSLGTSSSTMEREININNGNNSNNNNNDSLAMFPTGSSQLLFCPSVAAATSNVFMNPYNSENDFIRQNNSHHVQHHRLLNSVPAFQSSGVAAMKLSFPLISANPGLMHYAHESSGSLQGNKDQEMNRSWLDMVYKGN